MKITRFSLSSPEYLYLQASAKALKKALEHLPKLKEKKVLDIGCGSQWMQRFFKRKGAIYTGIDISESLRPNAVMAAERLGVTSESQDVVVSIAVLEHVSDPVSVVKEAARITKPGGVIIAQTVAIYQYHPEPHDHWRWTHTGLKKIFSEAGLKTEAIYPSGNTLTTYLTFYINGVNLLLAKTRIFSWTRSIIIPLLNLIGIWLSKIIPLKTSFDEPGNLIMSYAIVARKPD